jgi:chromosome segregation ATPase
MQHRKKARVSVNGRSSKARNAHQRMPSTSSSDEDEELPDAEPEEESAPASTQYEILRDGGFKHLENPDLDDQRATQKFLARRQLIGDNHAAENGIIQTITCINFMCHDKLHVEFGPLINFVVGMNGSGKSAVLTALTLCLGGKAASTNRGTSLKSLIKGGRDQAILIVRLKNQGNDAYQPEVYGESIIVERHFSKTGSSGYKLKNAMGRIISSKKGDVDDIVEYYQLQVDNPMNVLTQDAAKSFIHSSTPAQKYKFFYEGVQLEALDNDYRMISDTCDQIEAKLNDSKHDIKALKRRSEETKAKSELVDQYRDIRQRAKITGRQLAWAQVEEQEGRMAEREMMVAAAQERIESAEGAKVDKDLAFEQLEQANERAEESVRQLEEELAPLNDEANEAKEADDTAKREVQKAHSEQGQIKKSLTLAQKKAQRCQSDIDAEMKRMEDANGGAHALKLAKVEGARQAAKDARAALEQNESETPLLEQKRQDSQDALNRAIPPLDAKRKELDICRKRLADLNANRSDVMAGYDANIPRLMKMIRDDSGFREKPVGPMGLHIKLLNPIWSNIIETTIGRQLTGFVVTSKVDQMRLSGMLRQLKLDYCPIIIGNNHSIDTTGHEPDPQYETIMRVLEFDSDLVRRQLIINQGIEQSILVKSRTEASRIMFSGPKPKNVRQCFALHDSRRDYAHRLAFTGRNGTNQEMTPVKAPIGKARMKTDNESQITYQRETLTQLERELARLQNERRQLEISLQRCDHCIIQHKKAHGSLKINVQRADDRVEVVQAELDRDDVEDGHLDALKAYLAEAEAEVGMYQETYGNAALEKERLNVAATEKKRALIAVKERLVDLEAKVKKAQQKVRNIGQGRKLALSEKNAAVEAIEDLKKEKTRAKEKRDRQAAQLDHFIEEASKVCERVPIDPGESAETLDAKMRKFTDCINSYNRELGGSPEEINNAYIEAQKIYDSAKQRRNDLEELLSLLKQSFLMRMDQFRRFQRFISARSRINFNYLLSERAFRGTLQIDHKSKKLDVHVEPDETTKSSKGRQTKTLSGGEKSFSSICLLLALWEAMGAPLRCLDEFDVYMDDVNRDVSTKMIVSTKLSPRTRRGYTY